MALHKCLDCGREISDYASTCPHCGRPSPTASGAMRNLAIFLVVVTVLFFGGWILWKVYFQHEPLF